MVRIKTNVGQTGIESMRIGGMQINELPMGEGVRAAQQLPEFFKTQKENDINEVKSFYPKQSVEWIDGAIKECNFTIKNVQQLIGGQNAMINEYSGLITLCEFRDKAIARLEEKDGNHDEEIKELKLNYPPYNIEAMKQQIVQCQEAIERSNDVIAEEHNSILELKQLRSKCVERDAKLKSLDAI